MAFEKPLIQPLLALPAAVGSVPKRPGQCWGPTIPFRVNPSIGCSSHPGMIPRRPRHPRLQRVRRRC
ncbi:MAG: hypothetical protein ACK55I_29455, partial [bacterium]